MKEKWPFLSGQKSGLESVCPSGFLQVGLALTVLVAYVYTSFDIILALTELDGAITVEAIIAPKYLISLSVSL